MSDPQEPAPPAPSQPRRHLAARPDVLGGPGGRCRARVPGSSSVVRVPRLVGYIVDTLIVIAAVFAIVVVFGLLAVIVPILGGSGSLVGVSSSRSRTSRTSGRSPVRRPA